MLVAVSKGRLLIVCSTDDEHRQARTAIVGAAKDDEAGGYRVPNDERTWGIVARLGATFDARATEFRDQHAEDEPPAAAALRLLAGQTVRSSDAPLVVPDGLALYPYQETGARTIMAARRLLLADAPGVGKTIQALAWLASEPATRPVLVLCPSSVVRNWAREIERWIPGEPVSLVRPTGRSVAGITVLSYDMATRHGHNLKAVEWAAVIFDEAHRCNSRDSLRGRLAVSLARKTPCVLALSGTPVVNRPSEMYPILHMLAPSVFRSSWDFRLLYCQMHQRKIPRRKGPLYTWIADGLARTDELRDLLRCCMLRRTKDEVLAELPKKRRVTVAVDYHREAYEVAEAELEEWIESRPEGEGALQRVNQLRHLVGALKVEAALEWIADFVASGESLVVFAHHRDVIGALERGIDSRMAVPWGVITGETPRDQRQTVIDWFQDGRAKVLLCSLRAAGEGITLTRASDVLFVERDWTAAAEEQAEDRCHRIGQARPVTAWYLLAEKSIDEDMAALVERKRGFATEVLDSGDGFGLKSDAEEVCAAVVERRRQKELTPLVASATLPTKMVEGS